MYQQLEDDKYFEKRTKTERLAYLNNLPERKQKYTLNATVGALENQHNYVLYTGDITTRINHNAFDAALKYLVIDLEFFGGGVKEQALMHGLLGDGYSFIRATAFKKDGTYPLNGHLQVDQNYLLALKPRTQIASQTLFEIYSTPLWINSRLPDIGYPTMEQWLSREWDERESSFLSQFIQFEIARSEYLASYPAATEDEARSYAKTVRQIPYLESISQALLVASSVKPGTYLGTVGNVRKGVFGIGIPKIAKPGSVISSESGAFFIPKNPLPEFMPSPLKITSGTTLSADELSWFFIYTNDLGRVIAQRASRSPNFYQKIPMYPTLGLRRKVTIFGQEYYVRAYSFWSKDMFTQGQRGALYFDQSIVSNASIRARALTHEMFHPLTERAFGYTAEGGFYESYLDWIAKEFLVEAGYTKPIPGFRYTGEYFWTYLAQAWGKKLKNGPAGFQRLNAIFWSGQKPYTALSREFGDGFTLAFSNHLDEYERLILELSAVEQGTGITAEGLLGSSIELTELSESIIRLIDYNVK